ncbi:MAG: ABC transporter permease [bacterium]
MNLRTVWGVAVREFGNYFVSPIAYGFLTIYLFLTGYFTSGLIVGSQRAELSLYLMLFMLLFMTPLLTMRLISDEHRQGTIEFVFTSPITGVEFVLGKFLAVLSIYGIALIFTLEFPLFLTIIGDPDLFVLGTQYLGLMLVGSSFLAVGLFFSCLTENQLIAAGSTFCVLLLLWVMSALKGMVPSSYGYIVEAFNVVKRIKNFQKGIVAGQDVTFFLGSIVVFLSASVQYLNTRSWRQ